MQKDVQNYKLQVDHEQVLSSNYFKEKTNLFTALREKRNKSIRDAHQDRMTKADIE